MKNRVEIIATPELFEVTGVNDERLIRDLAVKMVRDMPIGELHKLIQFKKTDPFSTESKAALVDGTVADCLKEKIKDLQRRHLILFEAKCDL